MDNDGIHSKQPDFKLSSKCAVEGQSILSLASRIKYNPSGLVPPAYNTTGLSLISLETRPSARAAQGHLAVLVAKSHLLLTLYLTKLVITYKICLLKKLFSTFLFCNFVNFNPYLLPTLVFLKLKFCNSPNLCVPPNLYVKI